MERENMYTSGKIEFESHWVPHSFGLVLHRSKELRKLLHFRQIIICHFIIEECYTNVNSYNLI